MTAIVEKNIIMKLGIYNKDNERYNEYIDNIAKYQKKLYAYIFTLVMDSFAANDILQETNITLWKKYKSFKPGTNFNAWAYRIASYQVKAYTRDKKRQKWITLDNNLIDDISNIIIDKHKKFDIRYGALEKCIEKISASDRNYLIERYINELSLEKLSKKFNRSIGALKQVYHRIRSKLRKCVEEQVNNKPKI